MPEPRNTLQGGPLHPNAAIQQEYAAAIMTLVRKMHDDIRREMGRVFEQSQFHAQAMDGKDDGKSGTVASQARIALAALLAKYTALFGRLARKATKRMIERTLKNSSVTLGLSLREIAKDLTLKPAMADRVSDRLQEIITASTTEAAGLITRIPQQYLGDVQGAVMRSITGGGGMKDLTPFLNEKYGKSIRYARTVAMDQTRKSYSNITAHRMQDVGVRKFKWLHIGGSMHPRKLHEEMSGNTYSLDDLPYIGEMYGEAVYGKPGDLPNCRCVMRPIVSFETEDK